MVETILARHAESEANVRGVVNGDPTVPIHLTPAGREQAHVLGRELAARRIDLCVVTEFSRTRETADVALADRDVPTVVMPELNDPMFGFLEGRPLAEVREWFTANGGLARPDGGESRLETIERYCRGFRRVIDRPEPSLLVVAHALPVVAIRQALDGGGLPLTLAGFSSGHASDHLLSGAEMRQGVALMRRWVREVQRQ